MLSKQWLVTFVLIFLQMGCAKNSPSPHPIFTKRQKPVLPSVPVVNTETYPLKNLPPPVIVEKPIPIIKPIVVRPASKPLSPAVIALISTADENIKIGQLESAVVNIERALRIEPRNATLTYKLAKLRLKQLKPRLAENIARKATILAAGDKDLKKKSWLLIAQARHLQQDFEGAKAAQLKAQSLD
jgi:hypothetical protein